jgi:hypothetical protein
VERGKADILHPGWMKVVLKPEFRAFSIQGGPDDAAYNTFLKLPDGGPEQAKILRDWSIKFPQWWTDKGAKMASPEAADAVALVEAFVGQKGAGFDPGTRRRKNQNRLARAIQPAGSGGRPGAASEPSAEDSLRKGFRKVRGYDPGEARAAR